MTEPARCEWQARSNQVTSAERLGTAELPAEATNERLRGVLSSITQPACFRLAAVDELLLSKLSCNCLACFKCCSTLGLISSK